MPVPIGCTLTCAGFSARRARAARAGWTSRAADKLASSRALRLGYSYLTSGWSFHRAAAPQCTTYSSYLQSPSDRRAPTDPPISATPLLLNVSFLERTSRSVLASIILGLERIIRAYSTTVEWLGI